MSVAKRMSELLGVLTIVMKTKTVTFLTNQKTWLVSKNAEKNNNSENKSVRHLIMEIFPKICFVFIATFV